MDEIQGGEIRGRVKEKQDVIERLVGLYENSETALTREKAVCLAKPNVLFFVGYKLLS